MIREKLSHASVFTGIGGFDLAAEWAGFENIFSVEIDDYCDKLLRLRFPTTERHYDIKKFKAKQYKGSVDVFSGGVPCQPYSVAGKRRGIEDDRYLWEEYFRVLRELQPTWAIAENVPGITSMAFEDLLFNMEDQTITRTEKIDYYEALFVREESMLVENICESFEKEGYEVQSFIIPACGKGAWHRRNRIWFIAYSESAGKRRLSVQQRDKRKKNTNPYRESKEPVTDTSGIRSIESSEGIESKFTNKNGKKRRIASNSDKERCKEQRRKKPTEQTHARVKYNCENVCDSISSRLRGKYRGRTRKESENRHARILPANGQYWSTEPGVGRVADGIPNRVDRLKGLGNAIVPQPVYEFFRMISKIELKKEA